MYTGWVWSSGQRVRPQLRTSYAKETYIIRKRDLTNDVTNVVTDDIKKRPTSYVKETYIIRNVKETCIIPDGCGHQANGSDHSYELRATGEHAPLAAPNAFFCPIRSRLSRRCDIFMYLCQICSGLSLCCNICVYIYIRFTQGFLVAEI